MKVFSFYPGSSFRDNPLFLILTALLATCLSFPPEVFSQNTVSRPAGFLRIPLQEGFNLVSKPLQSFDGDDSINAVLGDQLSGSTNAASADRILKYNPSSANYIQAIKADGTGNPDIDGKWFVSFDGWLLSDMTLQPGEGFWIENRQPTATQIVFLTGEVVLDPTNGIQLLPSANLIGYPYSTAIELNETGLWKLWMDEGQFSGTGAVDEIIDPLAQGGDSNTFKLGRGYWYNRNAQDSIVWTEVRPYADIFPDNDEPPAILGISVLEDGAGVSLSIQGVVGEQLDIFFQDVSPTNRFDTTTGWMLAAANLPVNDSPIITWEDRGSPDRFPVSEVFGRYYLIGRAGQDTDGDNISDAREIFLFGSDPHTTSTLSDPDASLSLDSGTTNNVSEGTNDLSQPVRLVVSGIIYVCTKTGDDNLTGRSPIVVNPDGPKKTIRSGLSACSSGDILVIKEGRYGEDLNIAGKNVSVRIGGKVDLSGQRLEQRTQDLDSFVITKAPVPTGGITNAW